MCKPHKAGGYGFKRLEQQNQAFLMKIGFALRSQPNLLWVQVLRKKYGWNDYQGPHQKNHNCSYLWRHIKKLWPDVDMGTRWTIGDGSRTRFWSDNWLPEVGPLKLLAFRDITENEASLPVSHFASPEGYWHWEQFHEDLPHHILSLISGCKAPDHEDDADHCFWDRSHDGHFTVSSAYEMLCDDEAEESSRLWEVIWRYDGAQRVKVFLWLAARKRLLTNAERRRRHMVDLDLCRRCCDGIEDIDHVLRKCKFAQDVWKYLMPNNQIQQFSNIDFMRWILQNLDTNRRCLNGRVKWASLFGLTCWKLWEARNKAVFQNVQSHPAHLARELMLLADFNEQAMELVCLARGDCHRKIERIIKWRKPSCNAISLNCDGARKSDSRLAGAGSLLRDHEGRWIAGCCRHIGICTSLQAELWALMDGLHLAWVKGFRDVEVQIDCLVALNLVIREEGCTNANMTLIRKIQRLLAQDWQVTVTHTYREGNQCADFLATYALELARGYHILEEPPVDLQRFLRDDVEGGGRARFCYSIS